MGKKRNWITLGLLVFFLLSLTTAVLLHGKVSELEAEQASLQSLDFATIRENMQRNDEISRILHGRRGLYWYRSRAVVSMGFSAFLCFCDGMERLKRWVYKVL